MHVQTLTLLFAIITIVLTSLNNEVLTKKIVSIKIGRYKKQSNFQKPLHLNTKKQNFGIHKNKKQQSHSLKVFHKQVQRLSPILQSEFCKQHLQVISENIEDGGSFPHVAVLYERIKKTGKLMTYCGGSIISKLHILTTAHCLILSGNVSRKIPPNNIIVRVGMHHLGMPEFNYTGYSITLKTKKIIIHEHYDALTRDNDIALIKLKLPLTFTSNIQPLCINGLHFHYNFSPVPSVVVAGWGIIDQDDPMSNALKYAKLHITNFTNCWDYGSDVNNSVKIMYFCADYDNHDDGNECTGDSGSGLLPLNNYSNPLNLIVGILTGGGHFSPRGVPQCGNPMFFVNVTTYAQWINKAVNK